MFKMMSTVPVNPTVIRSPSRVTVAKPPAMIFLTVNTYLIASWWDWKFGASYGHRGFVDSLSLLAIGLAGFFE
jgi:hypothetical protein